MSKKLILIGLFVSLFLLIGCDKEEVSELINEKESCFELDIVRLYFDEEFMWEAQEESMNMPSALIPVLINDDWHNISLLKTTEEVCLNFSNVDDFQEVDINQNLKKEEKTKA